MHTVARRRQICNSRKNEVAALLAARGRDGLGVKFAELRPICGSAAAIYRAIEELTAAGWRIGRKRTKNGDFLWAIADSSGLRFPAHFSDDEPESFAVPMLAPRPVSPEPDL